MKTIFITPFIIALGMPVFAQKVGPVISTTGNSTVTPVSISYQKVRQCFPEIQDDTLAFKVDLNRLQEVVDAHFITSASQLRVRKVHYQDPEKHLRNLILRIKNPSAKKAVMELSLQTVDEKGATTDIHLTSNQKLNPKQEIINNFLLGAKILRDETWTHDTKLKGATATVKKNFKDVVEYELRDPLRRRTLTCETQKDLGIICICAKK